MTELKFWTRVGQAAGIFALLAAIVGIALVALIVIAGLVLVLSRIMEAMFA